jgi:hypothetical protein
MRYALRRKNIGDTKAIIPSANFCGEPTADDPGMVNLSGYAFLTTDTGALDKGKMAMGKVKAGGNENWVGFIGGDITMIGTPTGAKDSSPSI